jgi:hypothetical protein
MPGFVPSVGVGCLFSGGARDRTQPVKPPRPWKDRVCFQGLDLEWSVNSRRCWWCKGSPKPLLMARGLSKAHSRLSEGHSMGLRVI